MIRQVAIVGAGFSGTLQAINLLRHAGPRAVLIERAGKPGKGVAYGAAHPSHLLNVRAGNMSAFPDDPGHFARWLEARGVAEAASAFVPRVAYGEYLAELLDEARRRAAGRLEMVSGDVVDTVCTEDGVALSFADGRLVTADAAVLAVGNLPPHDPPGVDAAVLSAEFYKGDPWEPGVAEGLGDEDTVLVIGTGLTMVDVALMLDARGLVGASSPCRGAGCCRAAMPHPDSVGTVCASDRPSPPHNWCARCVAGRRRSAGATPWTNCAPSPRRCGRMPTRRSARVSCVICGLGGMFIGTGSPLKWPRVWRRCRRAGGWRWWPAGRSPRPSGMAASR